jgi:hypothetical protein
MGFDYALLCHQLKLHYGEAPCPEGFIEEAKVDFSWGLMIYYGAVSERMNFNDQDINLLRQSLEDAFNNVPLPPISSAQKEMIDQMLPGFEKYVTYRPQEGENK